MAFASIIWVAVCILVSQWTKLPALQDRQVHYLECSTTLDWLAYTEGAEFITFVRGKKHPWWKQTDKKREGNFAKLFFFQILKVKMMRVTVHGQAEMNSDTQFLHEHQINSTRVHFASLQKAPPGLQKTSPLACCHWHSVPRCTQYPQLAGIFKNLSRTYRCRALSELSAGEFHHSIIYSVQQYWKEMSRAWNPSVEAGIPCDCTGLRDKHDR